MYLKSITIGTYGNRDIGQWVESLPKKTRMVYIRDRMEQVLNGEVVQPLPMSDTAITTTYQIQIRIRQEWCPKLYKYTQYLTDNRRSVSEAFSWLLRGKILYPEYELETEHPKTNTTTYHNSQKPEIQMESTSDNVPKSPSDDVERPLSPVQHTVSQNDGSDEDVHQEKKPARRKNPMATKLLQEKQQRH